MNGLPSLFTLQAPGQPATDQAVLSSDGENTAFAESLTASLAASASQPVVPPQQDMSAPSPLLEGTLAGGQRQIPTLEGGETLLTGGQGNAGPLKTIDNSMIGMGANGAGSPPSGHAPDPAMPVRSPNAANGMTIDGGTDLDITLTPVGDAANQEFIEQSRSNQLNARTAIAHGLSEGALGGRLSPTTGLLPGGDASLIDAVRGQPIQSAPSRDLPTTPNAAIPLPSKAALFGDGQNMASATPSTLARGAEEQAIRRDGNLLPTTSTVRSDQLASLPASMIAVQSAMEADRSASLSKMPELAPRAIGTPAMMAGTVAQTGAPIPSTGLQRRGALTATLPENGRHDGAGTSFSAATNLAASLAYPDRSAAAASLAGRTDGPAANVTAAASQALSHSAAGVGPAATTMVEAGAQQGGEFGGFDRLQPILSLDAGSSEIDRFEPLANTGLARAQTSASHPSPGAQIAMQIVRSQPSGVDRLSVHLQPAELGSVDIQFNFESAGRVSAVITAERPETLELLQRDSRVLERSLGDAGLKLTNDGLSFGLKQEQQQQQGQSFHDQAQARETAFRAGRAYDDISDDEQSTAAVRVDRLRLLDIET